ncbi:Mbov_0283/Mbov_0339 family surface lipoprotein [Mycoplasmopsis bovis]|uniref:Mbov_0283/Mbov_0339 family surface lipoprotein n=1 Tax=Mycoplasmopsis bovis TaxID=28903 RepID=UPI001BDDCDE9|nr:variable surface lipoprotein [Mycoplasmopsis bovis]MBT1345295.1 variable surface lipoprotein [Mycoplasmopsis bovis]MBT1386946.1 variable surface lipoprotein [Mycoplasmopsis bovis]MBT1419416.1 variable surface lipoprotein [Mycoplasmopsis bovis]UJB25217.1 variable surface lipoprotein [Mycoplasmopsis bovis]
MKKSKFLLLTTLSPIISLPFLSASCITKAKADNKMEKDIKINENTDEKNSSETMDDKQKQDKSSIDSKMEEKADNKTEKDIKINENTDEKNSSETMNDKQKQDKSSTESKMKEKTEKQDSKTDDSSNESTRHNEITLNDMPIEDSKIDDYLNKVEKYGDKANLLITLLSKTENPDELTKKYDTNLWRIVQKFFDLHTKLKSNSKKTKKEIEEVIGDPESKNKKLDTLLKQYEKYRERINAAINELNGLKKK